MSLLSLISHYLLEVSCNSSPEFGSYSLAWSSRQQRCFQFEGAHYWAKQMLGILHHQLIKPTDNQLLSSHHHHSIGQLAFLQFYSGSHMPFIYFYLWWILSYIEMKQPRVYIRFLSWSSSRNSFVFRSSCSTKAVKVLTRLWPCL